MEHVDTIARISRLAETVRETAPLVHNMTNLVMQYDTAAVIAAVGGTQLTLHTIEEAADMAALSGAIAVNLGTLDNAFLRSVREALRVAGTSARPWVVDPVAAGLTAYRTRAAQEILNLGPTVIKGNASEILVLAGGPERGHGADSLHEVDDAATAGRTLAQRHGSIVVISGSEDMITDGEQIVRVANGRPIMGRMIGSGCMLTAVIGCFLAVSEDPFEAALAAVAFFNVAGEVAAESAGGPGSLKPLFIDALYELDRKALNERVRLSYVT